MKMVISTSKISYFLLLIVTIPVVANLEFILRVWLVDYPPMTNIYITAILCYYLVDALQQPLVTSVHATGNLKFHQIMIASIVIIEIPISYFLLYQGCSGATVLMFDAFANIVCAIGRTIYMKRLIHLNLYLYITKVIIPVIVVSVITVPLPIIMSSLYESTWSSFFVFSFSSCIFSVLVCFFLGLDKSEKDLICSIPLVKTITRKLHI